MSSPLPTTTSPLKTAPEGTATSTTPTKLDSIERGGVGEGGGSPPALPPRPPPRPRADVVGGGDVDDVLEDVLNRTVMPRGSCWLRKYVFLCTVCGGLAVLLGVLFLTVYFMLRSYTSSLHYFETIPTYIPASMLIVTGVMVMSLAGRRNRYSYLIKLCGACCLLCAVICVAVTVTTTVFHMSRLQSLRECVFTQKTQTCTCYSVLLDSTADRGDEGVRYIFNATPDCEVIHGALYSCLRAMFGLSVIGILVCIFSCMLVYQLLSHEKKKMYWEQLELRCRYLTHAQRPQHCACCAECRHPGGAAAMGAAHHEMFPWELDDRYWSPRVGNLYSPNPGQLGDAPLASRRSAWSWRRLPWSRTSTSPALAAVAAAQTTGCMSVGHPRTLRHATASPDSQYGFSSSRNAPTTPPTPPTQQYFGDPAAASFYTWGPPPPYSSPCRQQPLLNLLQRHRSPQRVLVAACHGRRCSGASAGSPQRSPCARAQDDAVKQRAARRLAELQASAAASAANDSRSNDNYVNTDDRAQPDEPAPVVRKTKKLMGAPRPRGCPMFRDNGSDREESEGYEGLQQPAAVAQCCHAQRCCRDGQTPPRSPRIAYLTGGEGVANKAFESREAAVAATTAQSRAAPEPTESEVYFGDVSSCCAGSLRADPTAQDGFIYDEAVDHGCHTYEPASPDLGRRSPDSAFHPISPDHRHRHLYTSPTFPEDVRPRPPHHEPEDPEDAVLRSNCFTYQMFSKRPQWDDSGADNAETSCSTSEAATPVTDTTFASPSTPCAGGDPLAAFYGAEGAARDAERLAPDAQYERSLGPTGDADATGMDVVEDERRMPSVRRKDGEVVRSVNV